MSRRPQRLIRLAQQLANTLGMDIDQDADVMTEEDLRELLNAAIDYVEKAEEEKRLNAAPPTTTPVLIGTGTGSGNQWGTWTTSPTYTHGHTYDTNAGSSVHRYASVYAS